MLLLLLRKSEALLAPHLHPGPDREKLEAPGTFFSLLFLLLVLCGGCYGGREAEVSGEVGGVEGAGDGCRKWKEKKEEIKLVGLHKKAKSFSRVWDCPYYERDFLVALIRKFSLFRTKGLLRYFCGKEKFCSCAGCPGSKKKSRALGIRWVKKTPGVWD